MMIAMEYDFADWKEKFIQHIKDNGNKPSVAKDYARRIEKILEEEGITIEKLYCNIDHWIVEYKSGKYASINKVRHYAPSSALIKFKAFAPMLRKRYTPEPPEVMDILVGKVRTDILY